LQVQGSLARAVTVDNEVATNSRTLHTLNVSSNPKKRFSMTVSGMMKDKKDPTAQKQKFGSPSLQASLRCQTLAFFATAPASWIGFCNLIRFTK
jgi:hypothetical protein